jgi:hypothetical protein
MKIRIRKSCELKVLQFDHGYYGKSIIECFKMDEILEVEEYDNFGDDRNLFKFKNGDIVEIPAENWQYFVEVS